MYAEPSLDNSDISLFQVQKVPDQVVEMSIYLPHRNEELEVVHSAVGDPRDNSLDGFHKTHLRTQRVVRVRILVVACDMSSPLLLFQGLLQGLICYCALVSEPVSKRLL